MKVKYTRICNVKVNNKETEKEINQMIYNEENKPTFIELEEGAYEVKNAKFINVSNLGENKVVLVFEGEAIRYSKKIYEICKNLHYDR